MHDTGTSAAGDGGAPAAASCKSSKTGIQSAAAAGKRGSRTSVEAAQLLKLTRKKKKNKKPKLPQGKPPQKKVRVRQLMTVRWNPQPQIAALSCPDPAGARVSQRLAAGEYLVESLLERRDYDHWRMGQIVQYKVKWVGYPMSKCTWEPSWTLPPELIFQFNNPELERERSNASEPLYRPFSGVLALCHTVCSRQKTPQSGTTCLSQPFSPQPKPQTHSRSFRRAGVHRAPRRRHVSVQRSRVPAHRVSSGRGENAGCIVHCFGCCQVWHIAPPHVLPTGLVQFLCCLPCLAAAGGQPSIGEIDDRPRCVPAVPLTQELGLVPRYCSKACQQSHWPQHKGVCSVPLPGSVAHPNREECESTERAQ